MSWYLAPIRATTISARITVADRRLIEAAAAKRRAPSLSAYIAAVVTEAARVDLFRDDPKIAPADQVEGTLRQRGRFSPSEVRGER